MLLYLQRCSKIYSLLVLTEFLPTVEQSITDSNKHMQEEHLKTESAQIYSTLIDFQI